jgi:hypothetical protein
MCAKWANPTLGTYKEAMSVLEQAKILAINDRRDSLLPLLLFPAYLLSVLLCIYSALSVTVQIAVNIVLNKARNVSLPV